MNISIRNILHSLISKFYLVVFTLVILGVSFVFFQVFCFSTFKIPSDSMSPELEAGDHIMVCKPVIGARIFNIFASLRNEQTTIHRIPGFQKIKRNDVLVFNFPCPHNWDTIQMHILKYYVKRCIGIPGDSLSIEDGLFAIKGYQGIPGNKSSQETIRKRERNSFEEGVFNSFPYDSTLNWNIKNFGPLYIPKAGTSVQMSRQNFILYKKMIEWEQKGTVSYRDSCVYLDNKRIDTYQFQKNYYFTAGDNGENSQDSRYWGLLPEEYIVGKAWLIWKSVDPDTDLFRWERLFKFID